MPVTNLYEVQVRLPKDSAIPADEVTNTWWFARTDLAEWTATDNGVVTTWLTAFYNSVMPLISATVNSSALPYKTYNDGDPRPRSPRFTGNLTPTALTATQFGPDEIAMVMSFQADRVSGSVQSRRRGRVYIGPIGQLNSDRPPAGNITTLRNAGSTLVAASLAHPTMRWVVHSRANNGYSVVTNGWVDNAWDVQRRRGVRATSRTTF